jgi:hypothetical protein
MTEETTPSPTSAFPKLMPLPRVERPVHLPVPSPAEVKTAADLPDRLLLGDLIPESFRTEAKGWSAEWRDADGPSVRVKCAGPMLSVEQRFEGDSRISLVAARGFADLIEVVRTGNPRDWLERLGARLETRYNLRVFPHKEEDAVAGDFPDGHLLSLVMPVPADRLLELYELHQRLGDDGGIRTGIDAYLRLTFSVVNYLEGRNPPMLSHPVGLVLHHVNALGAPAAELPIREVDPEGTAAWTLRRSHYLYLAHCHLREVGRLVDRLAAAGFIGPGGAGGEGYPGGPEFNAILLPFGYEYAARNAYWFDPDRRRRVFYPEFADPGDRNQLGGTRGDLWTKALLRDARKASERLKADTLKAYAEGSAGPQPG